MKFIHEAVWHIGAAAVLYKFHYKLYAVAFSQNLMQIFLISFQISSWFCCCPAAVLYKNRDKKHFLDKMIWAHKQLILNYVQMQHFRIGQY